MTRDEAIKIELDKLAKLPANQSFIDDLAVANIDALIELGLLKVDEQEAIEALMSRGWEGHRARMIFNDLIVAGFKIVKDDSK